MNPRDAAYTVALLIGAAIVGWCALTVFNHEHRISAVECVLHIDCPS